MAKFTADAVLDAACAKVATCTRMVVTSGQPANFTGIAAVALADVTDHAADNFASGGIVPPISALVLREGDCVMPVPWLNVLRWLRVTSGHQ